MSLGVELQLLCIRCCSVPACVTVSQFTQYPVYGERGKLQGVLFSPVNFEMPVIIPLGMLSWQVDIQVCIQRKVSDEDSSVWMAAKVLFLQPFVECCLTHWLAFFFSFFQSFWSLCWSVTCKKINEKNMSLGENRGKCLTNSKGLYKLGYFIITSFRESHSVQLKLYKFALETKKIYT